VNGEPGSNQSTATPELLLGRSQVQFDLSEAMDYLRGKKILITGAGGSIGSKLCEAVLPGLPAQIIAVDRSEQGIYDLDERLGRKHGPTEIVLSMTDVAERPRMARLFDTHSPDVVFHAAAYKHVRYVEENPEAGVINNVLGTRTVAELALQAGCAKFVLISSDKAVEPASIMGATKRLCEMITLNLPSRGETESIAVRFGNVVRSRGSVIPKFETQIAVGRPVTVHPQAKRYFMSMHEAVGLVLRSMIVGQRGDICIQKMGDAVRMLDIAKRLLAANNLPATDASFCDTELLPGEKLCEKLTTEKEHAAGIDMGHMLLCRLPASNLDFSMLDDLLELANKGERESLCRLLWQIVGDSRATAIV